MATMIKLYHYGYNQCGYMPDYQDDDCEPVSFEEAKSGLIWLIKYVFEDTEEYSALAEDINLESEGELTFICNGWEFWIIESKE